MSAAAPRVVVLADDLIWATRLRDGLAAAGAVPVPARSLPAAGTALAGASGLVVDLTARAYDPLAALRLAADAGVPAIAVGQHDDPALRAAARGAGASRVHTYRALFEGGPRELGAWVGSLAAPEEGS